MDNQQIKATKDRLKIIKASISQLKELKERLEKELEEILREE